MTQTQINFHPDFWGECFTFSKEGLHCAQSIKVCDSTWGLHFQTVPGMEWYTYV